MFRLKRAFNLQLIKNIFFPVHCSCCGKILKITSTPPYICNSCFADITLTKTTYCIKCQKPNDISADSLICPECLGGEVLPFKEFIAPLTYSGAGKAIVHNMKFKGMPSATKTMAMLIYLKLKAYDKLDKIEAFIPAPISKKRLSQRAYNQTELICNFLTKLTDIPTIKALKKIKDTPPQSTLKMKERLTNLDGAIIFDSKKKIPKNVAFIDDVYTTGTTASVCCNELKKNGAKNIYVVCGAINNYE